MILQVAKIQKQWSNALLKSWRYSEVLTIQTSYSSTKPLESKINSTSRQGQLFFVFEYV